MTKEKNNRPDESILEKYEDQGGVSLKEMNFGLWLSENRKQIRRAVVIILIIICAGLFVYSSYNYFVYIFSGRKGDNLTSSLLQASRNQVQEMEIGDLRVFKNGEKVDLAVKLKNGNEKFFAKFQYCFLAEGQEFGCGTSFVLPQEEKYLLSLGQKNESVSQGGAVSLEIKDVFWQRINSHQINDWGDFAFNRLNFAVSDLSFAAANRSGLSDKVNLNALNFTIKNATAYSYYEVPLNILLFNGEELVGVNQYLLNGFLAGQEENVKLSWPGDLGYVSRTDIDPDLNILDDSVYRRYQGASGQ